MSKRKDLRMNWRNRYLNFRDRLKDGKVSTRKATPKELKQFES